MAFPSDFIPIVDKTFSVSETFTSPWIDVRQASAIFINAFTDGVGSTNGAIIQFTDEPTAATPEITWDAATTLADPSFGGINVNFYMPRRGSYFRIDYTHGPVPGRVYAAITVDYTAITPPLYQIAFPLDDEDLAVTTRAVITRQDPEGNYVNQRQGGINPDLSTDTPLVANGVFRSPWVKVQGFVALGASLLTDQPSKTDGAKLQFARNEYAAQSIVSITNADPAVVEITGHGYSEGDTVLITNATGMTELNDRYFTISLQTTDTFELDGENSTSHGTYTGSGEAEKVEITRTVIETVDIPIPGESIDVFAGTAIQDGLVRLEYSNGAVAQERFNLHVIIEETTNVGDIRTVGSQEMEFSSLAQYTKALAYAHPSASEKPIPVFQDPTTRGQYAHIVGFDARVPIAALPNRKTGQLNANSLAASQITLESWCKTIAIKNMDANENIFVGFNSGVTANTGFLISPLLGDSYPINSVGEMWVISGAPVASTSSSERLPATINNSGALNPNNALTEDATFATLNDQGDSITALGYTAAGSFPDISKVEIGFKGRRAAATTTAIGFVDATNGTALAVPAVSSASVTANANHAYIACVSIRRAGSEVVSSISGMGLVWTQVVQVGNGEVHSSIWKGVGTPSTGVVTASLSGAPKSSVISVLRYSGVDVADPVTANTDTGTADSNSPTNTLPAFTANNRTLQAIAVKNATQTSTNGTERVDLSSAEANLIVNDRQNNAGITGTLSVSGKWAACAVELKKGPGTPPTVTLSHDLGPTTLVQQLTSTTNTDFTVDVTADRAWVAADIAAVEVTAAATIEVDIDAEIDYIYLIVEEIDTGGLTRVCWMQLGDTVP